MPIPRLSQDSRLPRRDEQAISPWYRINTDEEGGTAELVIFGEIGGGFFFDDEAVSAQQVERELNALSDAITTIRVRINSPGGSAFDGLAIANLLQREHRERNRAVIVDVEAFSGSAATIVQMGGQKIRIWSNAVVFIHKAFFGLTGGNADQLRSDADFLDAVDQAIAETYTLHSDLSVDELLALMAADTTMNANKAIELGFADEIVGADADALALPQLWVPAAYKGRVAALASPQSRRTIDVPEADESEGSRCLEADRTRSDEEENRMSYLSRVKSWFAFSAEAEDPEDQEESTTEPEGSDDAESAADVLKACREADCLTIAEQLVRAEATPEQVAAAVGRAKEIRQICSAGEVPELAEGLIDTDMTVDAVREHVAAIGAKLDEIGIDSTLDLDSRDKPKHMTTAEVYARRNGLIKEENGDGVNH